MSDIDILYKKIDLIKDEKLNKVVRVILESIVSPEFWTASASSTGKYHPEIANGRGGLVRHTVMMLYFAPQEARTFYNDVTQKDMDRIYTAVVLHDAFKYGRPWGRFTVNNHGEIASQVWKQVAEGYGVDKETVDIIADALKWHMGRWSPSYGGSMSKFAELIFHIDMTAANVLLNELFEFWQTWKLGKIF